MHRRVSRFFRFVIWSSCLVYGQAFASTVTYLFEMTGSDNGASATGEMVFASPPASSSSGWNSLSEADLLDWSFTIDTLNFGTQVIDPSAFNLVLYEFDYDDPQSLAGNTLDSGGFGYSIPLVPDALTIDFLFSPTPAGNAGFTQ